MRKTISHLLCSAAAALGFIVFSCSPAQNHGALTGALDPGAWDCSTWISAVDAPVVTGEIHTARNCRAADGASWFVSTVTNEKRVSAAK